MNGILNVFKPKGITSHDVVDIARRIFGVRRIGHTVTLDPYAAGVLILCIGKATRISEYLLDLDKRYIGEVCLGLATDTQDESGRVVDWSSKEINTDEIYKVFNRFKGKIEQIPPMYSAIKHKGKKLYEIAREGGAVKRRPRDVEIYELKILHILEDRRITFYTRCSKGTYIRTLCDDIGRALGVYGYMSHLIRVGVGDFKISDSYSLEYIRGLSKRELKSIICPMDAGLAQMDSITVDRRFYNRLINGAIVYLKGQNLKKYSLNIPLRVYCNNRFIGIGQIFKEDKTLCLKMNKVFV